MTLASCDIVPKMRGVSRVCVADAQVGKDTNCYVLLSATAIGADTVLKLGAQIRAGNFFSVPPTQIYVVPPIPGAQRGHTTVETDMVKITRVKKKAQLTWRQSRSQPRGSGGAPASGRWAWGWVRTNVSPSAAGVRGWRPRIFFLYILIQNPAF